MTIYQDLILDHYKNPRNFGNINKPTETVNVNNPLCGDKIHMEIEVENNAIKDIGFSGQGCAISQASASMLTEHVKGKSKEELRNLDKNFIISMLGVPLGPVRLKCALLPWEALIKLVK